MEGNLELLNTTTSGKQLAASVMKLEKTLEVFSKDGVKSAGPMLTKLLDSQLKTRTGALESMAWLQLFCRG